MTVVPSEAVAVTVFYVTHDGSLFAGDLVGAGMTPFLLEQRTGARLDALGAIDTRFPADTPVFPGHGAAGPLA